MVVFQVCTNRLAWAISLAQSSGDQSRTPDSPQKWPLKWVPISCPSSQARRTSAMVSSTSWVVRKPMSEEPTGCRGGAYCIRCSTGSA